MFSGIWLLYFLFPIEFAVYSNHYTYIDAGFEIIILKVVQVLFSLFLCVYLCYYIYIACKYCNKRPLEKQVPTSPEELPF
jgi:hypothetical protein